MSDDTSNLPTTRAIQDLKNHKFTIKDYQRGYKWKAQQVLDLIQDIDGFDPAKDGPFYCLQPLALMPTDDSGEYEVIDGQQRLTTIYIILSVINGVKPHFEISYETRNASETFLPSILESLKDEHVLGCGLSDLTKVEEQVSDQWKVYIQTHPDHNNTDIYHFFLAFKVIKTWLTEHSDKSKYLHMKLMSDTHFIWYIEKNEGNAKTVFRNLNSGKILLTNAELIKAHFINQLKDSNSDIQTLRQNELATEWDNIEKTLHDPRFWFFLTNETDEDRYETRIDLLFGILAGSPKYSSDKYFTYRKFTDKSAPDHKLDWKHLKLCFYQLHEWYEDNDFYHLIGYLVYAEICNLSTIILDIRNNPKSKSELRKYLVSKIRDFFLSFLNESKNKTLKAYLEILKYDSPEPIKRQLVKTLVLYNIQVTRTSKAHYRFPFDKLKNHEWSLEHIHAQNADDLSTVSEIRSWITDIESLMKDVAKCKKDTDFTLDKSTQDLFTKIRETLTSPENRENEKINEVLKQQIATFSKHITDLFDLHNIRNLALLDGSTNSSFSNKCFRKKREALIQLDKQSWEINEQRPKPFIPIGTTYIFLKYTSSDPTNLDLWGWQDREDYFDHLCDTLKYYLVPANGDSHE
jgi:uncharacterized protein with ParB-like and HNH nuclease domain